MQGNFPNLRAEGDEPDWY